MNEQIKDAERLDEEGDNRAEQNSSIRDHSRQLICDDDDENVVEHEHDTLITTEDGEKVERRPRSLGFAGRLAAAAQGIRGAVVRSATAAGTMLTDTRLRRRGAAVISSNASKGIRGIQQGKRCEGGVCNVL